MDERYHIVKVPKGLQVGSNGNIFTTTKDTCIVLLTPEGQEVIRESRLTKKYRFSDGTTISQLSTGKIYTVVAM